MLNEAITSINSRSVEFTSSHPPFSMNWTYIYSGSLKYNSNTQIILIIFYTIHLTFNNQIPTFNHEKLRPKIIKLACIHSKRLLLGVYTQPGNQRTQPDLTQNIRVGLGSFFLTRSDLGWVRVPKENDWVNPAQPENIKKKIIKVQRPKVKAQAKAQ